MEIFVFHLSGFMFLTNMYFLADKQHPAWLCCLKVELCLEGLLQLLQRSLGLGLSWDLLCVMRLSVTSWLSFSS